MNGQSPFQPRILAALGAALVALFAASMLLTGAGGRRVTGNPVGSNTYSRSAVGHLGLFEVLQKLGYRAVRSETGALAAVGTDGVLVVAEPTGFLFSDTDTRKLLGAQKILVILPKRDVRRSEARRDWIDAAQLSPGAYAQSVFSSIVGAGDVFRVEEPSGFQKSLVVPDPTVSGPMQLVANSKMTPLVATAEGILLGEFRDGRRRIWVLTDPDPIENHGLGKGVNLAFINGVLETMLDGKKGTLVFDETFHGFQHSAANPLKFLLEFPFNLIAIQVVMGAALLLLAAMGRFGVPETPDRVLKTGKRDLISNAASLIDHAGHHAAILRRYASMMLQDTGRLMHAPRQLNEAELVTWLDKAGEARRVPMSCRDLLHRVAVMKPGDLVALLTEARTIHRWRKDILNGISTRLGDH